MGNNFFVYLPSALGKLDPMLITSFRPSGKNYPFWGPLCKRKVQFKGVLGDKFDTEKITCLI